MKKLASLVLLSLLLIGAFSCKKLKELFPGIDVDLPAVTILVPVNPGPSAFFPNGIMLPRITQEFNLDSVVRANTNNQFGAGDVSLLKVKALTFTVVQGGNQANNLANFENIKFDFSSNKNSTPVRIADYNFPDTYTTMANVVSANSPDLISYLGGSELYYDVTVKPRRAVTSPFTVEVTATVTAK